MDESARDGDALAHAAGKGAHERSTPLVKADFAEQIFGTGDGRFHFLQPCEEEEIFLGGKFVVNHGAVADIAGTRIACGISGTAGKGELSGGGACDLARDAEKRGLARAVAPGEDSAFAGGDFEGDAPESE